MSEHAQHKCQIEFQERKFKKRVERKLGKGWVTELRLMDYFLHVCILSHFSHVRFFATPWTVACQAPLSTGFSRQEYWSGKPLPPPGDLPDLGIESRSPAMQADPLLSESPGEAQLDKIIDDISNEKCFCLVSQGGKQITVISLTLLWNADICWKADVPRLVAWNEPLSEDDLRELGY